MRRVAFGLYTKEYLTLQDIYELTKISARLKSYLKKNKFLAVYLELKNAVKIFTGKKRANFYEVVNLKKFYEAHGFVRKEKNAIESQDSLNAVSIVENLICYYSAVLNIPPLVFARQTPVTMLSTLQKMITKMYVDKWRNMLFSYHAPQSFKEYLDELINAVENMEANGEIEDKIAKAIARSPNLNRKPEPHWANAEAFLKSRILQ